MPDSPPTPAAVLAVLPAFVRKSDSAEVRDALVAALTAILLRYEELTGYSADQCDIATGVGVYLEGLCEDRGIIKQQGETDDQLRARALTTPDLVTPAAILAAANTILASYTAIQAQYCESVLDRWFVQKGGASWNSFVGANPRYLARLYPEDAAANGGFLRPNSRVGGAWAFGNSLGRYFILRVPVLDGLSQSHAFVATGPGGFFASRGSPDPTNAFVYLAPTTALTAYQFIASAVNRIRGHSMRWLLSVDPNLTS